MIKELYEKILLEKPNIAPLRIWKAYEHFKEINTNPKSELIALVSLIRRVSDIDNVLTPYDKTVDKNFQDWAFRKQAGVIKYNEEQMQWLRLIKEHITMSFHISQEDFDYNPFNAQGGLGKFYELFGEQTEAILEELNEVLVA